MTISDNLTIISNAVKDIKQAIMDKGQTPIGDITTYATAISNISGESGVTSKYGAVVDNFLGDVDENGVLKVAGKTATLNFSGVKDVQGYALRNLLRGSWIYIASINFPDLIDVSGQHALEYVFADGYKIGSINFPNLSNVSGQYALYYAFNATPIESDVSFPSLTDIAGTRGMQAIFQNSDLNSAYFPKLEDISGEYAMIGGFYGSTVKSVDLSALKQVSGEYALYNCFYGCKNITSIDISNLQKITGERSLYQFLYNCTALESISFPALINADGDSCFNNVCYGCTVLANIQFPLLETLKGADSLYRGFYNCKKLTSISFPNLKQIGSSDINKNNASQFQEAFVGSGVTEIEFPELESIYCTYSSNYGATFRNNTTLTKLSFPKLKTIVHSSAYTSDSNYATGCKNIFYGCTSLTELHFGAENQEAIESTLGYETLWGLGAGTATVYFDL